MRIIINIHIYLNILIFLSTLFKLFYFVLVLLCGLYTNKYEGWNFNSGNYLFTTDTKWIHVSKFYCPSL